MICASIWVLVTEFVIVVVPVARTFFNTQKPLSKEDLEVLDVWLQKESLRKIFKVCVTG